jgi:hypothetical protein
VAEVAAEEQWWSVVGVAAGSEDRWIQVCSQAGNVHPAIPGCRRMLWSEGVGGRWWSEGEVAVGSEDRWIPDSSQVGNVHPAIPECRQRPWSEEVGGRW